MAYCFCGWWYSPPEESSSSNIQIKKRALQMRARFYFVSPALRNIEISRDIKRLGILFFDKCKPYVAIIAIDQSHIGCVGKEGRRVIHGKDNTGSKLPLSHQGKYQPALIHSLIPKGISKGFAAFRLIIARIQCPPLLKADVVARQDFLQACGGRFRLMEHGRCQQCTSYFRLGHLRISHRK